MAVPSVYLLDLKWRKECEGKQGYSTDDFFAFLHSISSPLLINVCGILSSGLV